MSGKYLQLLVSLCVLPLAAAQTIIVDNITIVANSSIVAPAAENITSTTADGSNLFASETLQLTDAVIANLTALGLSNITLFGFPDQSPGVSKRSAAGTCKTYPGDSLWPSAVAWDVFDLLLGGSLIKTVPIASPCYEDYGNYDEVQCAWLTNNWANNSYFQTDDPTSVNAELYQNSTCIPPEIYPYDHSCTLGGYPEYVVNVSTVAQIQLAINLARTLDLRLIIKNTGHDFLGRSTAYGSLSLWTHNLKDYEFYDSYSSGDYTGPAVKAGSGIQAFELYKACQTQGVTCIGGEGATVGVLGGYIQGGGHSPMSTLYGMAADHALAYEVVTPDGRFVTADGEHNSDLFWALRGGGGGTFGVVTSVTVKTFPKIPVTIMTFELLSDTTTTEAFWGAIQAYWNGFVNFTDAGCYSYFFIVPNLVAEGVTLFKIAPFWAPNMTEAELEDLLAPVFSTFTDLGLNITPTYQEFDNFYDAWEAGFPLEGWGVNAGRQGGRLWPKSNWDNGTIAERSFAAVRAVAEDDGWVFGFSVAPGNAAAGGGGNGAHGAPDVAVPPAWRRAVAHVMSSASWDVGLWASAAGRARIAALSDKVTGEWTASWAALTPGSGAYHAEADYMQPGWQQAFWGDNYARLLGIKEKYDPYDLFYVHHGVGSEGWGMDAYVVGDVPSQAGKLCRV